VGRQTEAAYCLRSEHSVGTVWADRQRRLTVFGQNTVLRVQLGGRATERHQGGTK
jgi:hypothetical protein